MLYQLPVENVLFLDIETVPIRGTYEELPGTMKELWDKQAQKIAKEEDDTPSKLFPNAGLYSEFGKIVCISVGFVSNRELRIKSFFDDDESRILEGFAEMLNNYFTSGEHYLCAHNGKEFDFPFIARRMIINHIKLPDILNTAVLKPWQVRFIDTMDLWKFGNYRKYTSLNLLTAVFDIPTPKDDIKGSDVGAVYYVDNNLERIKDYCQKDVIATVQVYHKFLGEELIEEQNIVYTT